MGGDPTQTSAQTAVQRVENAPFESERASFKPQRITRAPRFNQLEGSQPRALADGAHVRTLEGHTSDVRSACVSPDGQHVVTASDDMTARVHSLAE